MDELKVYTGKEAFKELLDGKTLNNGVSDFKFEGDDLLVKTGNDWSKCYGSITNFLECKFTEVATLKVGDIVYCSDGNCPGVTSIKEINGDSGLLENGWNFSVRNTQVIHHATPEQITEYKREQVFLKVGRKPDEYRENDIVFLENTGTICMVTTKSNFNGNVGVKEINKPQKWNASVKRLTPICFAENLIALS